LDGVFAQAKFAHHLTIAEAIGHQRNDLHLARNEQAPFHANSPCCGEGNWLNDSITNCMCSLSV